jgi:hypothetical protein
LLYKNKYNKIVSRNGTATFVVVRVLPDQVEEDGAPEDVVAGAVAPGGVHAPGPA